MWHFKEFDSGRGRLIVPLYGARDFALSAEMVLEHFTGLNAL